MFLGIDLGTSKVAAVIVDRQGASRAVVSQPHHADLPAAADCSEQDAEATLAIASKLVRDLPADLRGRVEAIGVTGQVHGFAFVDRAGRAVSPQYTWQDRRCDRTAGFLSALQSRTGYRLSAGFAPVTIAWLLAQGELPPSAEAACNICDLLVQRLGGLDRPVTDTTQAASWGLFDLARLVWDETAIAASGVPRPFFPKVLPCGARAATLAASAARDLGLSAGISIAAGIGDNQASVLAALTEPASQLLLTLGTGGQVSAVVARDSGIDWASLPASCERRPHVQRADLAVSASLCGGSAFQWLARLCASWMRDLSGAPTVRAAAAWSVAEAEVYERLNALGADVARSGIAGGVVIQPSFLGERHDPWRRGRIEGLDASNMSLGETAWALALGIIRNLHDMMVPAALQGRTAVVGTGNALRRNPLLRSAAEAVFGLPLIMPGGREEAAVGAALVAGQLE